MVEFGKDIGTGWIVQGIGGVVSRRRDSFALLDNITICGRVVGSFEMVWQDVRLVIKTVNGGYKNG